MLPNLPNLHSDENLIETTFEAYNVTDHGPNKIYKMTDDPSYDIVMSSIMNLRQHLKQ